MGSKVVFNKKTYFGINVLWDAFLYATRIKKV